MIEAPRPRPQGSPSPRHPDPYPLFVTLPRDDAGPRAFPALRSCPVTLACAAVLTVVFLAEWWTGALLRIGTFTVPDPLRILALGANSSDLVQAGEWSRLVTGNFLHGGMMHFVLNVLTLLYLGAHLEILMGGRRFLTLVLLSCLGGSAASAYLSDALSAIGVSTGLLGLIGANAVLAWRFAEDQRRMLIRQGMLLLSVWILALPIEWFLPVRVDHFGHLGGLMAGVAYVLVAMPEKSLTELLGARKDPAAALTAGALTLLFLGAAGHTAWTYAREGLAPTAESFLAYIEVSEDPEETEALRFFFNNAAWTLAIDPAATREQLETALDGMRWAEEKMPEDSLAERDTLATLFYRLGDARRAAALERVVLELSQEPELRERYFYQDSDIAFFASQLARFEWARYQAHGPELSPGVELPRMSLLRLPGSECAAPSSHATNAPRIRQGILLEKGAWGTAVEIHAVLMQDDAPLAFIQVVASAEAPIFLEYEGLEQNLLACDVRPVVTLAEAIEPIGLEEPFRWQVWNRSEDVAELP